jgi:hypothetical protein
MRCVKCQCENPVLDTNSAERTQSLGHFNWDAVRVVLEDKKLKYLLQRYGVHWLSSHMIFGVILSQF